MKHRLAVHIACQDLEYYPQRKGEVESGEWEAIGNAGRGQTWSVGGFEPDPNAGKDFCEEKDNACEDD